MSVVTETKTITLELEEEQVAAVLSALKSSIYEAQRISREHPLPITKRFNEAIAEAATSVMESIKEQAVAESEMIRALYNQQ